MDNRYLEFYVNSFNYISSEEQPQLDFLLPMLKRRLSNIDKYTIYTLKNSFNTNTENIIFSSQNGEIERLLKIIKQYSTLGETSPNTFAGSVLNYIISFFLINEKKSVPYSANSSGKDTITMGLLSAIISQYSNTLFCYSNENEENSISFALNIEKIKTIGTKYRLKLETSDVIDDYKDYIRLFKEEISELTTPMFKIERVDSEN